MSAQSSWSATDATSLSTPESAADAHAHGKAAVGLEHRMGPAQESGLQRPSCLRQDRVRGTRDAFATAAESARVQPFAQNVLPRPTRGAVAFHPGAGAGLGTAICGGAAAAFAESMALAAQPARSAVSATGTYGLRTLPVCILWETGRARGAKRGTLLRVLPMRGKRQLSL